MKPISLSCVQARQRFGATMRMCADDNRTVIIRSKDCAVAMIPLAEYESSVETSYLLRSPTNARRLRASLKQAKERKLKKLDLNTL